MDQRRPMVVAALLWVLITIEGALYESVFEINLDSFAGGGFDGVQSIAMTISGFLSTGGQIAIGFFVLFLYYQHNNSLSGGPQEAIFTVSVAGSSVLKLLSVSGIISELLPYLSTLLAFVVSVLYILLALLRDDLLSSLTEPVWSTSIKYSIILVISLVSTAILGTVALVVTTNICPNVMDPTTVCAGQGRLPTLFIWYGTPVVFLASSKIVLPRLPDPQ